MTFPLSLWHVYLQAASSVVTRCMSEVFTSVLCMSSMGKGKRALPCDALRSLRSCCTRSRLSASDSVLGAEDRLGLVCRSCMRRSSTCLR